MADSTEPKKETVRITVKPTAPNPHSSPLTQSREEETARITVLPNPPAKPAVKMKETQPLIGLLTVEPPVTRVTVAPQPRQAASRIAEIPRPLCWALVAASAAILILQIWNYLY